MLKDGKFKYAPKKNYHYAKTIYLQTIWTKTPVTSNKDAAIVSSTKTQLQNNDNQHNIIVSSEMTQFKTWDICESLLAKLKQRIEPTKSLIFA